MYQIVSIFQDGLKESGTHQASGIRLRSTFSKRNTFGARTKCLSKTDVRLINSQIKGSEKGKDQLLISFLIPRYPSYKKILLRESRLYHRQKKGHLNLEKSLHVHGNKKIICRIMRTQIRSSIHGRSSWWSGRKGGSALNASNLWGRRSPSYFTALQDINNLET